MNSNWDKIWTGKLVELGINWTQARIIVGMIAEERQTADRLGYKRGYKQGYDKGRMDAARSCSRVLSVDDDSEIKEGVEE